MAKKTTITNTIKHVKKVTSIGNSKRTRPKNKKNDKKKYRGQGK